MGGEWSCEEVKATGVIGLEARVCGSAVLIITRSAILVRSILQEVPGALTLFDGGAEVPDPFPKAPGDLGNTLGTEEKDQEHEDQNHFADTEAKHSYHSFQQKIERFPTRPDSNETDGEVKDHACNVT